MAATSPRNRPGGAFDDHGVTVVDRRHISSCTILTMIPPPSLEYLGRRRDGQRRGWPRTDPGTIDAAAVNLGEAGRYRTEPTTTAPSSTIPGAPHSVRHLRRRSRLRGPTHLPVRSRIHKDPEPERGCLRTQTQFREVLNQAPAGASCRSGRSGDLRQRGLCRLSRLRSPDELIGRSMLDLLPIEDRAAAFARYQAAEQQSPAPLALQLLRRDGQLVTLEERSDTVSDFEGGTAGWRHNP